MKAYRESLSGVVGVAWLLAACSVPIGIPEPSSTPEVRLPIKVELTGIDSREFTFPVCAGDMVGFGIGAAHPDQGDIWHESESFSVVDEVVTFVVSPRTVSEAALHPSIPHRYEPTPFTNPDTLVTSGGNFTVFSGEESKGTYFSYYVGEPGEVRLVYAGAFGELRDGVVTAAADADAVIADYCGASRAERAKSEET